MRIVFVNSAWPESWGGGEKWTVEAAEWFRERGDEVSVIGRAHSKLIAAAQKRNLSVVEHRFGGDFDPLTILKARQLLKEFDAELSVVNFNKEAWQFGLAAKTLKIPVVARHGFPLLRKSLHHRQLTRNVLTKLVVNAGIIKEQYAVLGFDTADITVIHNGVKFRSQRSGELRRRFGIASDDLLILAAGRVESQKRFDRIIPIVKTLLPAHPNLKTLIAGEGPLREYLEQDVRSHGLTEHIRFTGFIQALAENIGDADIFLLTSDEEGTPNVLLEAMAARVACVAFAVGAVPEILAGELAANAVLPSDVPTMIKRVEELLNDADLRDRIAGQMQLRTHSDFAFERSMQQFAELFDHTVRGSK